MCAEHAPYVYVLSDRAEDAAFSIQDDRLGLRSWRSLSDSVITESFSGVTHHVNVWRRLLTYSTGIRGYTDALQISYSKEVVIDMVLGSHNLFICFFLTSFETWATMSWIDLTKSAS